MKYHELTENVWKGCFSKEDLNKKISAWLEEKAQKLARTSGVSVFIDKPFYVLVREILGLSPLPKEPEVEPSAGAFGFQPVSECLCWEQKGYKNIYAVNPKCPEHNKQAVKNEAPMEQVLGWLCDKCRTFQPEQFKFCGFCGTQRPEEPRKALWQILRDSTSPGSQYIVNDNYHKMANAALDAVLEVIDSIDAVVSTPDRQNFRDELTKRLEDLRG